MQKRDDFIFIRPMKHFHLIGPGGAGKSTLGATLLEDLGFQLIDLDEAFLARFASIGQYIERRGYLPYAHENVELYFDLLRKAEPNSIFVLSSGFMCYPSDVHFQYGLARKSIESQSATVMLVPSFKMEECIRLTVARQCAKDIYFNLP